MFPTASGAAMALTKRSRRDTSRTAFIFNFFFFVQILFQSNHSWYFWMCSLDSVPIQFRMVVAVRNVPSQRARAIRKRAGENYWHPYCCHFLLFVWNKMRNEATTLFLGLMPFDMIAARAKRGIRIVTLCIKPSWKVFGGAEGMQRKRRWRGLAIL